MKVKEAINKKYGSHTLRLAAEGFIKPWAMKQQLKTPNCTTPWMNCPLTMRVTRKHDAYAG